MTLPHTLCTCYHPYSRHRTKDPNRSSTCRDCNCYRFVESADDLEAG